MFVSNDWAKIRAFYQWASPRILAERADEWAIDPYEWDRGFIRLTPIETALWHDIRANDLILYPQYPVGRFFVDFANPVARVAIECDGKNFHLDKEKDASRDQWLTDREWSVYRITGSDCMTDFDEEQMKPGNAQRFIMGVMARHSIGRNSTQRRNRA